MTLSSVSDDCRVDYESVGKLVAEMVKRYRTGKSLDDLLPEAFAVAREAGRRKISMRHYDVQLIGGIVLHQGKIAEMRTGEGKTLVATLPSYLNGLTGRGVNVVTVNDYLASRDAEWMGKIHEFLGLSVGPLVFGPVVQSFGYAAGFTAAAAAASALALVMAALHAEPLRGRVEVPLPPPAPGT